MTLRAHIKCILRVVDDDIESRDKMVPDIGLFKFNVNALPFPLTEVQTLEFTQLMFAIFTINQNALLCQVEHSR